MVKVNDTSIFIHNGHDNDNEKLNDLWKFNEIECTWTKVNVIGEIP